MPQSFLDDQWLYALINQICHMTMPDIMHSDWFYTSQCFIFLETFLQRSRHNREQPLIFQKSIMLLCILLYLFLKKIGNINSTDRIFCFWSINHISFPDPVIGLIDMQEISTHIKIRKTQCQKFSFPDSGDADKILDQLRVRRFICILTKTASVL